MGGILNIHTHFDNNLLTTRYHYKILRSKNYEIALTDNTEIDQQSEHIIRQPA